MATGLIELGILMAITLVMILIAGMIHAMGRCIEQGALADGPAPALSEKLLQEDLTGCLINFPGSCCAECMNPE